MSANNDYKLGRVEAGDNVRSVARASRINALQNISRSQVAGDQYGRTMGTLRAIGPGWVVNRRHKIWTNGGGGGQTSFPFQIKSRIYNDTLQLGVIQDSHLFNSEARDQYEYPNTTWGLLDYDEQNGWFDVGLDAIGQKIWLEIELREEDQVIESIELRHGFPGTELAWSSFPDPIEIDTEATPKAQQFYHQIIGEISNPDVDPREAAMILTIPNSNGTRIQVNQLLCDNIFMTTGHTTHDADQPDIPLLINAGSYGPVTDTGGTGTPFPPDPDIMTPWQFGTVEAPNHYNFEMINASDEDGAKVCIYDGAVYTLNNEPVDPAGMTGHNDYVISVENDDEVWVGFVYENKLNYEIVPNGCWIATGAQTPDDDPEHNTAYVTLGHVKVDYNEPESINVVHPFNEVCGDIMWNPPRFDVHFNFQLEDASEQSWAKVRIYDGAVYSANNEGVNPAGMPCDNTYVLTVEDTYEIWVGFVYENKLNYEITYCWIATGPQTPDDDPSANTAYVTIGHVDVNYAGDENIAQVYPFNEVCGDIFWEPPRYDVHFNFQIEDASDGFAPKVKIYDGSIIGPNDDPVNPQGMPSNNSYVIDVQDGYEIWVGVQWDLETDDGVSGDNIMQNGVWIATGPQTPDDSYLTQYITIGHVDVNYQETFVQVFPYNEICGDIIIQYPPYIQDGGDQLKLTVDKSTSNIVWKADIPDPPDSGTYILGVVDGDVKWIDTTDCTGG